MTKPQLWIIAGPNGAGKTTLTGDYLTGRVPVVNPDEIARALDPNHNGKPEVMLQAGREAIGLRAAYLAARQTFAVETTLTGKGELQLIQRASDAQYKVNLFFVGLDDVTLSAGRVAARVRSGGHPVPLEDIFRRFDRSLSNVAQALPLADRAFILDNSGERRRLLISIENGRVKYLTRSLPAWAARAIPTRYVQSKANRNTL